MHVFEQLEQLTATAEQGTPPKDFESQAVRLVDIAIDRGAFDPIRCNAFYSHLEAVKNRLPRLGPNRDRGLYKAAVNSLAEIEPDIAKGFDLTPPPKPPRLTYVERRAWIEASKPPRPEDEQRKQDRRDWLIQSGRFLATVLRNENERKETQTLEKRSQSRELHRIGLEEFIRKNCDCEDPGSKVTAMRNRDKEKRLRGMLVGEWRSGQKMFYDESKLFESWLDLQLSLNAPRLKPETTAKKR